ncbi:heme biosynthesis HemY N-terminal domain-containing protein [Acidisphaera sp. S103]|uniref:heme biosynthesis HemY N-terminal domain-containing protein n=1 Tax=Acidisphaera sp. S103 TaxID=1747223 RepID=UPI00131DB304|nr:heme biosynthesis HemY N-terminal domain-containing protein [Acidisphaera sp. S103]
MLKVILFVLVGCVTMAAAWLLAGIPGHVVASIGAYTVETSTPIAILMLVALLVVVLILLRIVRGILAVPRAGAGWRRRHRLALGERTVTRVLIALAAGEPAIARKEARRGRHLLGDSPQTLLLVAEAARLSGREDEAEEAFRALTKQKDASFLGLRGLLRQAVDRRDWPEALIIAKQAEAAHPGTAWLRQQRAELALQTENWAEALELIGPDSRRSTYYIAAAAVEADPSRALAFAKQAWRQDPAFAPAVLAYASRLRAAGHEKRAQSCIADAWKRVPHPDLAAFALALEPDKLARARAGKRLVAGNPTHPESRLLLARVALDAGLTGEARHQLETAEKEGLKQQRLCLLLAEIEEQEYGDTEAGRLAQRDALRRAATAEPDPHWQCTTCRTDHAMWHPKCDVCGGIGTIQWSSAVRTSGLSVVTV